MRPCEARIIVLLVTVFAVPDAFGVADITNPEPG
jgi:hypothetical protein